jgi:hypothetical protein
LSGVNRNRIYLFISCLLYILTSHVIELFAVRIISEMIINDRHGVPNVYVRSFVNSLTCLIVYEPISSTVKPLHTSHAFIVLDKLGSQFGENLTKPKNLYPVGREVSVVRKKHMLFFQSYRPWAHCCSPSHKWSRNTLFNSLIDIICKIIFMHC